MMAQLFLEAKGVVARQLVAAPFHLPWFECFGAFELDLCCVPYAPLEHLPLCR